MLWFAYNEMQVNARCVVTHGTAIDNRYLFFHMRHILCNEMTGGHTPPRVTVVNYCDYRSHVLFSIVVTCVRGPAMRLYHTRYCIIMSTHSSSAIWSTPYLALSSVFSGWPSNIILFVSEGHAPSRLSGIRGLCVETVPYHSGALVAA